MSKLSLKEKISEWAGDSPVVGFAAVAAFTVSGLIRGIAGGLKGRFDLATKPLSHFEPKPPEDNLSNYIYKQELAWTQKVMGGGRVEKLLNRLKAAEIPEVVYGSQAWALSQSTAGLTHLPQHEQLVKYGLYDNCIAEVTGSIRSTVCRQLGNFVTTLPRDEWKEKPETFIQGDVTQEGIKLATTGEIIRDRDFLIKCCVQSTLLSRGAYIENGPSVCKVANVVLDWLNEDVKPDVPEIFGEMKVSEFAPERKNQDFTQSLRND